AEGIAHRLEGEGGQILLRCQRRELNGLLELRCGDRRRGLPLRGGRGRWVHSIQRRAAEEDERGFAEASGPHARVLRSRANRRFGLVKRLLRHGGVPSTGANDLCTQAGGVW